jgi:CDGSH-type Zn-finger protein
VSDVKITVTENGPLSVKGPFTLVDQDGNTYELGGRKRVALCRCGGSTTKPFCDGTHSRIGFQAAERAVAEADAAGHVREHPS